MAQATTALVVTGGTNSGVMGLVGKTMSEQSTSEQLGVCLGIATLGIVKNHEQFVDKSGKIHNYDPADDENPAEEDARRCDSPGEPT